MGNLRQIGNITLQTINPLWNSSIESWHQFFNQQKLLIILHVCELNFILLYACLIGNVAKSIQFVQNLIEKGATIETKDKEENTPLHLVVKIIFKLFNIIISYWERNPQLKPLASQTTWEPYETYQGRVNCQSHKINFLKQISKMRTISLR